MVVRGPDISASSVFQRKVINDDFLLPFVDWAVGDPNVLKKLLGGGLPPNLAGEQPTSAFLNRNRSHHYRSGMPHSAVVSGTKESINQEHSGSVGRR
jgi:hypothetical protein